MKRFLVYGLILVGVPLATACAKSSEETGDGGLVCAAGTIEIDGGCGPACGQGRYWADGGCADMPQCGDGTAFDEAKGQCVPADDVCGEGTHAVDGGCANDLECGEGTHMEGGECVPDTLGDADVTESTVPGQAAEFILPEPGEDVTLGGTVDAPEDVDGDGSPDGDWDTFSFTAGAGTWLRIEAASDGAAQPAFIVDSDETGKDGAPLFRRISLCPTSLACSREVYLPRAGTYSIVISDYTHVNAWVYGFSTVLVGGPDFTYLATVTNLGTPTPANVASLPHESSDDLDEGRLVFSSLASLGEGDVVELLASGVTVDGLASEVYPILMLFDGTGAILAEDVSSSPSEAAALALVAKDAGPYLVVHDHLMIVGPNRELAFRAKALAPVDCGDVDCGSSDVSQSDSLLLKWDLTAGQALVIGTYFPVDGQTLAYQQLLAADGEALSDEQEVYPGTNGAVFGYAEENTFLYLWIRWGDGATPATCEVDARIIDTPELTPGKTYTGLAVNDMPPYTYYPAGIDHVSGLKGKMLFFSDLATTDGAGEWVSPFESIMTPRLEQMGPVIDTQSWNFPDGYCTPPFAYVKDDGHVLHWVRDPAGSITGSTYDVRVAAYNATAMAAPTVATPSVKLNQSLAGMGFYTFTAGKNQYVDITVTPVALSDIQPRIWVMNFGEAVFDWIQYVWSGDPDSPQLALVAQGTAAAQGDALTVGYVSPYDGMSILLVSDEGGAAGILDLFNVKITVPPPPDNDTCAGAEPIALDGDGHATVTGSTLFAVDSGDQPMCTYWSTAGPDVYYSLELADGETVSAAADGDGRTPVLYLLRDCADPEGTCVAGSGYETLGSLEYTVPDGAGGTYLLAVDGYAQGVEFTLNVTVEAP
jgi:hypothetical protein